ncbi:MAG: putative DNA binding domain-containing protein [Methanosarcinales archaeon]|nr:putative DNA binding domain-containing protein [Methanosarcinales archaeon]
MDIKELTHRGESQSLEFKESLKLKDEIGETVSAFSNSDGGTIIVGASDNGGVPGVDIGKNTLEELANYIKRNTDPHIFPSVKIQEVGRESVVVVEVKGSAEKPVFFKNHAYKRVGKTNQMISSSELRKLAKESGGRVYWDERVCEDADLEDIEEEKVRWFLKEARHERGLDINESSSVEDALLRLKLLKAEKPTNGAVLLFGRDPQRKFIQSEIKCIRFKGVGVTGEMIDLRTVDGDVFDQLIEAEKFIFNNIALSAWIEDGKIQRQERWEYPPKAIREALANAISHRDYETTSKVQVRIFDDRMEFWNPGRLPEGWTVETLRHVHESIPGNPSIAKQFFWVKYIEEVGTGTNKIIEWCIDWGLPEPEFEFTGTSLVVTLWKSKLNEEYLNTLGLNERQREAISYMKEHKKITSKEYAELFSITDRTARNDLKSLLDKKILIQRGTSKKSTYYELSV